MKTHSKKIVFLASLLLAIAVPIAMYSRINEVSAYTLTPPVTPPQTNQAPYINTTRDNLALTSTIYQQTVYAYDLDHDVVTVKISNLPKGLNYKCAASIDNTRCLISGKVAKPGKYSYIITATDEHSASTSVVSTLDVLKK